MGGPVLLPLHGYRPINLIPDAFLSRLVVAALGILLNQKLGVSGLATAFLYDVCDYQL